MKSLEVEWSREFVYYLGFLWADGHVTRNTISISIKSDDGDILLPLFSKVNFLKFNTYRNEGRIDKRSGNLSSSQLNIYFCNVKIYDEFFSKYFINKSTRSPLKLIEDIPVELVRYFYLGLVDGDGCFFLSKDSSVRCFNISSSYEQDWSHIENMCSKLNISKYKIVQNITKSGKSSSVNILRHKDISLLCDYLYPFGFEIGLKRKYEKCKLIVDTKPKRLKRRCEYMTFEESKKFIQKLNFKSIGEWYLFRKSKNKPIDLPGNPDIVYRSSGWTTLPSWLGYEIEKMNFEESKEYIKKFCFKNREEWYSFCKTGKRLPNLPGSPNLVYKNTGWKSWGNWLGYQN